MDDSNKDVDCSKNTKKGKDRLWEAVRTGTLVDVRRAAEGCLQTAGQNDDNVPTAVQLAIQVAFGKRDIDDDILLYLLSRPGVNVNAPVPDCFQRTPFIQAVVERREAVVNYLLQQPNIDVNAADSVGMTALHYACSDQGSCSIAMLLLQQPTRQECYGDHQKKKKKLCCHLNVNARTKFKHLTPLHYAARNLDTQLVERLLQHPDIQVDLQDCQGNTPLHMAAAQEPRCWDYRIPGWGGWNTVRLLLVHPSMDLSLSNEDGATVLHQLIERQAPVDIIEQCLLALPNHGGITHIINKQNWQGKTPLDAAIAWPIENESIQSPEEQIGSHQLQVAVVDHLLQHPNININSQDPNTGNTALHNHILANQLHIPFFDIAQQLLDHAQMDLAVVNNHGLVALHIAFCKLDDHSLPFVQALLHHSPPAVINCGTPRDGQTPLHYAVAHYSTAKQAILSALLQSADVNVNAQDHYGNTPLHTAVCSRQTCAMEVLGMLLNHPHIRVSTPNKGGQSAADKADSQEVQCYLQWMEWIELSHDIKFALEEENHGTHYNHGLFFTPTRQPIQHQASSSLLLQHQATTGNQTSMIEEEEQAQTRIHTTYQMLQVLMDWLPHDRSQIPHSSNIFVTT